MAPRGALEGGLGGWRLLAKGPDEQGDQMSYFTRTVLLRLTAFLHCVLYLFKIVYSLLSNNPLLYLSKITLLFKHTQNF